MNFFKNEILEGLTRYFPKDAHQKSEQGSVRSDLKKLDPSTLETSKNHLIHNFLRNGRLRVKEQKYFIIWSKSVWGRLLARLTFYGNESLPMTNSGAIQRFQKVARNKMSIHKTVNGPLLVKVF